MLVALRRWMECRRQIRRRWRADARRLVQHHEPGAYYDAQRLAARARASGQAGEFVHWAKVAAEVARISPCARMDIAVVQAKKKDIEELRERVPCAAVLEKAGFAIDLKESTRKAVKYRRGDDIIIVIHDGKGWFDPLSDVKGDVFSLVEHLDDIGFAEVLQRVSELVGFVPSEPVWPRRSRERDPDLGIPDRWRVRRSPWRSSMTWRYLRDERGLPETVIRAAIQQDRLREGPRGSMWAAHVDDDGVVTGWEERGAEWRGFASGGGKVLFRLGPIDAIRLCITEAAIDAMSLAALEELRSDSFYLSTGGGWAPATEAAIRRLASRPGALLVAATDNNEQGEVYAERIAAIGVAAASNFERLKPAREDWNEELRDQKEGKEQGGQKRETRLPHIRPPRQGRLRPLRGP